MPTPEQYRLREDGKVSILIFHDVGKLRGLMIFPSIFSGKHLKYTNQMTILEGKTIQVKYNEPAPLQIDGEVVPEVMEYTVRSCVSPAEKAKQDSEMAAEGQPGILGTSARSAERPACRVGQAGTV